MRVVIAGATGQVGRMLTRHFRAQGGHTVSIISRKRDAAWAAGKPGAWVSGLERCDVCINLAGRSVNCRYNRNNRKQIYESRVQSTRLLNEAIASLEHPPALWLNASTATIYRHALDRPMDENSGELGGNEPGAPDTWNFSIDVAKAWEETFFALHTPRTRKIALRSAMTFSPDRGGVFDVLLSLARYGLGGTQGLGTQYVSWIHEADFVRAVDLLIEDERISGPVNLASPNPLPNRDFLRILRQAAGIRFGLPAPAWLLEIGTFLLRTESELVLKSRRVIPGRLLEAGFRFQFPDWPAAARDLVARQRQERSSLLRPALD